MSKWMTVQIRDGKVFLESGAEIEVGHSVRLGLGTVKLRRTERAGLHFVRLSGSGQFSYALMLRKDGMYRLGPNRGHRVVAPSEEGDPIKRVLRELGIPVTVLERPTETTLLVDERWYDNSHCPVGRNTHCWVHDGQETIVSSTLLEEGHHNFGGGGRRAIKIEGASYAVCIDSGRYMNGGAWSRPGRIMVWPGADATVLGNALSPYIWGKGADLALAEALNSVEAAMSWLVSHGVRLSTVGRNAREVCYDFEGRLRAGCLLVDRGGFAASQYRWGPVQYLAKAHGLGIFGEIPPGTAEFLAACADPEKGEAWVKARYNVVLEGDRVVLYSPETNQSVASFHSNRCSSGGSEVLWEILWAHGWDTVVRWADS